MMKMKSWIKWVLITDFAAFLFSLVVWKSGALQNFSAHSRIPASSSGHSLGWDERYQSLLNVIEVRKRDEQLSERIPPTEAGMALRQMLVLLPYRDGGSEAAHVFSEAERRFKRTPEASFDAVLIWFEASQNQPTFETERSYALGVIRTLDLRSMHQIESRERLVRGTP